MSNINEIFDPERLWELMGNASFEKMKMNLNDPEVVRNWKLQFARVGVFNPRLLSDLQKDIQRMRNGIPLRKNEFWEVDQWGAHPLICLRVKSVTEKKNRANWSVYQVTAPLKITPHAFGRYRERTGGFFDPEIVWNIPHIPNTIMREVDGVSQISKSHMLPVAGGAFLGYPATANGGIGEIYRYKKRQLKYLVDKGMVEQFYAITFISRNMMSWEQIDICDAYEAGDWDRYHKLSEQNAKHWNDATVYKL